MVKFHIHIYLITKTAICQVIMNKNLPAANNFYIFVGYLYLTKCTQFRARSFFVLLSYLNTVLDKRTVIQRKQVGEANIPELFFCFIETEIKRVLVVAVRRKNQSGTALFQYIQ